MPAPLGNQGFTYEPVELPVLSPDPAQARPIGVGPVAAGGNTVDINISVGPFSAPVNVAVGVYAAAIDGEDIYFMGGDDNLRRLSTAVIERDRKRTESSHGYNSGDEYEDEHEGDEHDGSGSFDPVVLWKKDVTAVDQNLYGPISVSDLPSGLYVVSLIVKSADHHGTYRWTTHFTIP
jgi:hypothetical protein